MPKFQMSYAYDVPHYVDFVVEADTPEDAQRIAQEALDAGRFNAVDCKPFWDNACEHRVFDNNGGEPITNEDAEDYETLEEIAEPVAVAG